MELLEEHHCFEGRQQRWRHDSAVLNCAMTFSIFLPPSNGAAKPPVLYWLSGLTCNDENFTTKAGAQRVAAELGIALVMPDTSPRGDEVADDAGYDLGKGAGFYLNATQEPWARHYRMYDYLRDELPALIQAEFAVSDRSAISGHSMGGHGALVMALKNPGKYVSVSAFSPIVNPSQVPWGQKAFTHYLGEDAEACVGRMALSNYLLQTLICTTLFYQLGLFMHFDRLQLLGFVLPVWLVNILFSVFWLRHFRQGPLEWLWRQLTARAAGVSLSNTSG